MKIVIGEGSCGIAAGAAAVHSAIEKIIPKNSGIKLGITGCIGMCFLEPIVDIYEEDKLIKRLIKVKPEDAGKIVSAAKNNDFSSLKDITIAKEDEEFL
ncbi:MAG: (2Fe-2S) ferredoxin domain-containing protein, partial [Oscillospiraceae bacterium]|nr:(2Fe-2S) ferredoxin domain-containing protein [Oscillospiraceae bacterium]